MGMKLHFCVKRKRRVFLRFGIVCVRIFLFDCFFLTSHVQRPVSILPLWGSVELALTCGAMMQFIHRSTSRAYEQYYRYRSWYLLAQTFSASRSCSLTLPRIRCADLIKDSTIEKLEQQKKNNVEDMADMTSNVEPASGTSVDTAQYPNLQVVVVVAVVVCCDVDSGFSLFYRRYIRLSFPLSFVIYIYMCRHVFV